MSKFDKNNFIIDDATWRAIEEQNSRVDQNIRRLRESTHKTSRATGTTQNSPQTAPSTSIFSKPIGSTPSAPIGLKPAISPLQKLATLSRKATPVSLIVLVVGLIGITWLTIHFFISPPSSSQPPLAVIPKTANKESYSQPLSRNEEPGAIKPNVISSPSSSQPPVVAAQKTTNKELSSQLPSRNEEPGEIKSDVGGVTPILQNKADPLVNQTEIHDTYFEMIECQIQSNPEGAEVYFDEKLLGVTPVTLKRPPGKYRLRLKKDGYQPIGTTIKIFSTSKTEFFYTLSQ